MARPDALPDGTDADISEQQQDVEPDDEDVDSRAVTSDREAPEADAYEQAQRVPLSDEEDLD